MKRNFFIRLSSKNKFLLLFLIQLTIIAVEHTINILLFPIFEIILYLSVLYEIQAHSCYNSYSLYTFHRGFFTRISMLCVLNVISLENLNMFKGIPLILLVISVYAEMEERLGDEQISKSIYLKPSYRSLYKVLNNDRWLDLMDQGYFLCNKSMELVYTNKRGEEFMRELDFSFNEFITQLTDIQETNFSLRWIMENLLGDKKEGDMIKVELGCIEKRKGDGHSFSGSLLCNYKARICKLNTDFIFAIVNKKDKFSTLSLNKNIRNATVSTLSHELKTVLNAVIGNLYLLEDSIEKINLHLYNLALSSAHVLSNKLNDLFDYIQIQESDFKAHLRDFSVRKLVEDINSICKWLAKQKNLEFSTRIESQVPSIIKGDESRVNQIMLGILTKAIEYTEFGEVNLRVKVNKKGWVVFKISAIGTGTHYTVLTEISKYSNKSRKQQYKNLKVGLQQATENMGDMDLLITKLISEAIGAKLKFTIKGKNHTRLTLCLINVLPETIQTEGQAEESPLASKDKLPLHGRRMGRSLTPVIKNLNKDEFEYLDSEIPNECRLPEGITKGRYLFSVNTMTSTTYLEALDNKSRFRNSMTSKNKKVKHHNSFQATRRKMSRVDSLRTCNVLIADDNITNRSVLKGLLKKYGFDSIEVQDGSDAVDVVKNYVKSGDIKNLLLIYMDLQMPIMNGIEATRAIIELCTNAGVNPPPIIGLSADSLEEDRYKFELAGINEFISKPVDKSKLNNTIRKYIKRSCYL